MTDQPPKPCPLCRAEPFVGEISDYQFAACSDGDCVLGKTHLVLGDWNELHRLRSIAATGLPAQGGG